MVSAEEEKIVLERLKACRFSNGNHAIVDRVGEHARSWVEHPRCYGERLGVCLEPPVGAAIAIRRLKLLRQVELALALPEETDSAELPLAERPRKVISNVLRAIPSLSLIAGESCRGVVDLAVDGFRVPPVQIADCVPNGWAFRPLIQSWLAGIGACSNEFS
jgi:hypothetical protein